MESLSKTYVNTHGQRLKAAFAETLLSLLHPIGKVRAVFISGRHRARS